MITSTLSPEFYLKNKNYFDDRLIEVLENLDKKNKDLKGKIEIYEAKRLLDLQKITDLRFKLKDTQNKFSSLKLKKKTDEERIEDIEKVVNETLIPLYDELGEAIDENVKLREKIKELEEELKKYRKKRSFKTTSANSNLPPSQDPFRTPGSKKPKSGKSVGGQPGHSAHRIKMVEADAVISLTVKKAPAGAEKKSDENGTVYYVVQNISCALNTTVTEYRYYIDETQGIDIPEEIMERYKISSVTYDSSIRALTLYMNYKGAIALDRLCVMLKEMSRGKINVRPGTIVNWTKEFSRCSEEERRRIAEELLKSEIIFVDETGWKVDGKLEWLHAVSNGKESVYFLTDERSGEDGPVGFLQNYSGKATHDHFITYYTKLPKTITHVECNAHIDRELQKGIDDYDSIACARLIALMHEGLKKRNELKESGKTALPEEELEAIRKRYQNIIVDELERYSEENPGISAENEAKYIKTFRRMLEYENEHLRYLNDFEVPYTNTIAERCMRTAKARKKISGQNKNMDRGKEFANIMTVVQTANWSGINTLEKMEAIIKGN